MPSEAVQLPAVAVGRISLVVTNVDNLITQLQGLSRDDQQKVMRFLLIELEGVADPDWENAWAEELARRDGLEAEGKITSLPWPEALAKLRERYACDQ